MAANDQVAKANATVLAMSEPRYVLEVLRTQGVAPYLATDTVAKRCEADIRTVMTMLQCDAPTAIRHINRGILGPEPSGDEGHGRSARNGRGEGAGDGAADPLRGPV